MTPSFIKTSKLEIWEPQKIFLLSGIHIRLSTKYYHNIHWNCLLIIFLPHYFHCHWLCSHPYHLSLGFFATVFLIGLPPPILASFQTALHVAVVVNFVNCQYYIMLLPPKYSVLNTNAFLWHREVLHSHSNFLF